MNTTISPRNARKSIRRLGLFLSPAILAGSLLLVACGGPSRFPIQGTERAPGMDGEVSVDFRDSNHRVLVEVEHLPPPTRIEPGATTFLVWLQPESGNVTLLGRLVYDEGDRSGRLEATTVYDSFTIIVTAETEATPTTPGGSIVLRQDVAP